MATAKANEPLNYVTIFGDKLKKAIIESDFKNVFSLAEIMGVDQTGIYKNLKANSMPEKRLNLICKLIGKEVNEFIYNPHAANMQNGNNENQLDLSNVHAHLNKISEKLDKLDYINRNICELHEYMETLIKLNQSLLAIWDSTAKETETKVTQITAIQ